MIVVSDTSPLNVLVRIEHVELLPQLFGRVLIPPAVAAELSHLRTPEVVRVWLAGRPDWLGVQAPLRIDPTLGFDDPGESEAISLALEIKAELLLADDKKARRAAKQRGIATTGVIGILELAAAREFVKLGEAFGKLRETDFNISQDILDAALARDAARQRPRRNQ